MDPVRVIGSFLSPKSNLNFVLIVIRVCAMAHVGNEIAKSVCAIITVAIIVLPASIQIMLRLVKVLDGNCLHLNIK